MSIEILKEETDYIVVKIPTKRKKQKFLKTEEYTTPINPNNFSKLLILS